MQCLISICTQFEHSCGCLKILRTQRIRFNQHKTERIECLTEQAKNNQACCRKGAEVRREHTFASPPQDQKMRIVHSTGVKIKIQVPTRPWYLPPKDVSLAKGTFLTEKEMATPNPCGKKHQDTIRNCWQGGEWQRRPSTLNPGHLENMTSYTAPFSKETFW